MAVLSHDLWQGQFGEDPDILGRTVSVNGEPWEVVGVMPRDFRSPTPWGGRDGSRLWTPILLDRGDEAGRGSHWLGAYGRMADGVRPEQVEAELDTIATQLAEAYPDTNGRVRMWVQPMMQRTLGGISSTMAFLLVVVGLVLLIACANVASMLLARGMNRSGEFAIRASMGAGRRRLARQLLTESLLLAIIGGMTGVAMAYWGVDALKAVLPDSVPRVAGVALLLIVAGTYGVVSYAVSQRTQEIGVRMTLGADKAGVRRLFLARVAVLFGFGLAIGALGALASASMTRSMVFGISALSPVHMLGAAVVMIVVALGATLVPVRRATGVDPLVALRSD